VINLKTAGALGLMAPPLSLRSQAMSWNDAWSLPLPLPFLIQRNARAARPSDR
jgi:hypothetical protein